jgi:hypothetical protein
MKYHTALHYRNSPTDTDKPTKFVVPSIIHIPVGILKKRTVVRKMISSLSLVQSNYYCQASNAIPVHFSCDWGFIASFPVAV